jgi:outer membrane protein
MTVLFLVALSLSQAVDFAITHSPAVAKQEAVVAQYQAQYVRQRSQALPNLNGLLSNQVQKSANFAGSFGVIGASQASVFSQNTAQLGTQYTYNGGLSQYQTLVARQTYEQSKADLRKTKDTIATDVTTAFYNLASKNETVRLDMGDLQYQSVLVRIAKAKERAGVAAGVDVLSANAQEEKSRYTLEAARADADNTRESLAQLIGATLDTQFSVPVQIAEPALPQQSVEALVALALTNRPEVTSAQEGVNIAQTNRRSADTDLFPQIQTFASFGNQFSPTLYASQLNQVQLQNVFNAKNGLPLLPIPSRGTPGFWNIGMTSQISLPLWDWGNRRANHRNLDEQIAAQQNNLSATQTQVELDVRQAYRGARTALAQLASAQDETRYALEAARIARLQYEHGIKTLIDVLATQQTSLSAQTDLFNARVAYVDALVKLRVALGIYDAHAAVADL